MTLEERKKRISAVTAICAAANVILAVAKLCAGILGKSAAMTADAVHAVSDVLCDGIVLVMTRVSARGCDAKYNWGRGKYEALATLAISVLLVAVAADIVFDSIESIRTILTDSADTKPGALAIWVAVASIVVKELIFQWTSREGRKLESTTMVANAWHHRSDALASVGSLVGAGGAILLGGRWAMLDPAMGCVIGVVVLAIAVKMLIPAVAELVEKSLPEQQNNAIRDSIEAAGCGKLSVKLLKTRRSGHFSIAYAEVTMDREMNIGDAYAFTLEIENCVRQEFGDDLQITVRAVPGR